MCGKTAGIFHSSRAPEYVGILSLSSLTCTSVQVAGNKREQTVCLEPRYKIPSSGGKNIEDMIVIFEHECDYSCSLSF